MYRFNLAHELFRRPQTTELQFMINTEDIYEEDYVVLFQNL